MVTKLGPLCKVKLFNNQGDKLVVRSPEKAGVGGSTPSLATISFNDLRIFISPVLGAIGCNSRFSCVEKRGYDTSNRALHSDAGIVSKVDYREPLVRGLSNKSHVVGIDVQFHT